MLNKYRGYRKTGCSTHMFDCSSYLTPFRRRRHHRLYSVPSRARYKAPNPLRLLPEAPLLSSNLPPATSCSKSSSGSPPASIPSLRHSHRRIRLAVVGG
uniref:Uncharacterized protein n=1 Tax=Oryza sativa subsp. japonica TaxID=39947 RepID=Q6K2C2_ORYSJ|nr:hypothetical protein [Oryza sativa Japonica Group]BAD23694.1 hypothetical protein [Oryza sativa Japonica Group]